MSRPFLRRLAIVFAASAVLSGIGGAHAEEVLRIGFQKSSTLLTLIRSQGTFERELARQGIRVSWHEFPSGLPLLESLNVGNVDLSADVADTVPVFAQAAGARLTYFARGAGDTGRRTFAAEVPGRAEGQAHRRDQGRRQPLPAHRRAGQRRA